MKSCPNKGKAAWAYIASAIDSKQVVSRINFNWFNIINLLDCFLLVPQIFKSLIFKTNLNCSYILLLDIVSFIMQWGFCKYVVSKIIKD